MSKNYTTLIFDLFGTLVNVFSVTTHGAAVVAMADLLHIPLADFTPLWEEGTYPLRSSGAFTSIEENLAYICRILDIPIHEQQIEQAANVRYAFTRQALQPKHAVIETLVWLKHKGYQIGLISNCAPDVPLLWEATPFASLIDVPIFSCEVQLKKPDARIYQLALERLKVTPERCLYIGDGSDRELSAAQEVGMSPVLIRTPLHDAYDTQRADVNVWNGHVIHSLKEIIALLT